MSLQIESLAHERSCHKRDDDHGRSGARKFPIVEDEHLFQCTGKTDEQNAESGCFEQGILHASGDELSANEANDTSYDNEGNVDESSQSGHE